VGDTGIPRDQVEAARRYFETYRGWRDKEGAHLYELRGFIYCGACGRRMTGAHNNGYYYYSCMARRNHGKRACPESVNYRADGRTGAEHIVMRDIESLLQDPERVRKNLDEAIARETATLRNPGVESATWLKAIEDCKQRRSRYQDLAADGLMTRDELAEKLRTLDATRSAAETKLEDARAGESRLEELRATKRGILGAYAHGILYDGIRYFDGKMRHDIYDALGLRIVVETDGTLTVDYHVDANVIRLTREVEEYAAEPEITVGPRSRSGTDMGIVVMKCSGDTWRPRSGAASTKVATTPALMADRGAPAMRM